MKRILPAILAILILIPLFSGCGESQSETAPEEAMNQELLDEYHALLTVAQNANEEEWRAQIAGRLEESGRKPRTDKWGNISCVREAEEGNTSPAAILQCNLSLSDPSQAARSAATALYVFENAQAGSALTILFTDSHDELMTGVNKISPKILEGDRLINLDGRSIGMLQNAGAGMIDFSLTQSIQWQPPTCTRAFHLSVQNLSDSETGFSDSSHPNPIKTLGSLLTDAKSVGILIELAGFNGGSSIESYPTAATAVILLNDNDVSRFTKRFETAKDQFLGRYAQDHPYLTYSLVEVPLPDKVVSDENFTGIISLLNTAMDGAYERLESGSLLSVANLGTISTHTGNFQVELCGRSLSSEKFVEMAQTLQTICSLCNIEYSAEETYPLWEPVTGENNLTEVLSDALEKATGQPVAVTGTIDSTECALLKRINPNLDVVSISAGEGDDPFYAAEALLTFL